jgi:hypothetical protein
MLIKINGIFVGVVFTLLNLLLYDAKGREFVPGVIAGIALILWALYSKVSDTKKRG